MLLEQSQRTRSPEKESESQMYFVSFFFLIGHKILEFRQFHMKSHLEKLEDSFRLAPHVSSHLYDLF